MRGDVVTYYNYVFQVIKVRWNYSSSIYAEVFLEQL